MARLMVDGDELVLRLAWLEKVAARHGDVRMPLAAVDRITAQPEAWRALRGVRERGLLIPGALCLGVWRHPGGQDFVAVRLRRGSVVCVDLRRPSPFARTVATSAHPQATVAALRRAMDRASATGTAAPGHGRSTARPEPEPDEAPRRRQSARRSGRGNAALWWALPCTDEAPPVPTRRRYPATGTNGQRRKGLPHAS
ncbi:hypothetical protein P3T39_005255 [Kitasatospora sp. GP82]|nr:hypothetical protein [Kitasatospora sp. GP82]